MLHCQRQQRIDLDRAFGGIGVHRCDLFHANLNKDAEGSLRCPIDLAGTTVWSTAPYQEGTLVPLQSEGY
jgi:hypothetical protein